MSEQEKRQAPSPPHNMAGFSTPMNYHPRPKAKWRLVFEGICDNDYPETGRYLIQYKNRFSFLWLDCTRYYGDEEHAREYLLKERAKTNKVEISETILCV